MTELYGFRRRWLVLSVVLLAALAGQGSAQFLSSTPPPGSADLVQPADLVRLLASSDAKPAMFYVGPRFLFGQAHIRGSEFIGPASTSDGLDALRRRVAAMPKNSVIVLYCGCCPWDHCPNVTPAFHELRNLGFTRVKVLYMATSFGADWVDKGFPFDRGQ